MANNTARTIQNGGKTSLSFATYCHMYLYSGTADISEVTLEIAKKRLGKSLTAGFSEEGLIESEFFS
jgi:hypothetical protein